MNTSSVSEMPQTGVYSGRSHTEYRRAQAHSRRVRALKILLPLASVLVIIGFVAVSFVGTLVPEGVAIDSVAVRNNKLVMQNPVMSGQTSDARPYRLEAVRAVQDLATPNVIVLEDIQADLPVSTGQTALLEATSATYDRDGETLVFSEPFKVSSDGGFSAEMQSANIDMVTSEMITSDPVTIRSPDASVVANSMKMQDKGRLIILEDKVRMTINPSAIRSTNRETN